MSDMKRSKYIYTYNTPHTHTQFTHTRLSQCSRRWHSHLHSQSTDKPSKSLMKHRIQKLFIHAYVYILDSFINHCVSEYSSSLIMYS